MGEYKIHIQSNSYPEAFCQFLVVVIGWGGVNITLEKAEAQPNLDGIGFTGISISSAGIIPFFRCGVPAVTLRERVFIGMKGFPFGLLGITTWINSSKDIPPVGYTLTLQLVDVEFEL